MPVTTVVFCAFRALPGFPHSFLNITVSQQLVIRRLIRQCNNMNDQKSLMNRKHASVVNNPDHIHSAEVVLVSKE